jgi:hypothetical protein
MRVMNTCMSTQLSSRLSDDELIAEMNRLARCERHDVASLIAHIGEFEKLADGSLNLTTVDLVAPQLSPTNYREVLEEASGKSKREVQIQVAARAPALEGGGAEAVRQDRPTAPRPSGQARLRLHSGRDPAGGVGAGWRPLCVHRKDRAPLQRDLLPAVPPRHPARQGRPDDRRQPAAPLRGAQPLRGGSSFRPGEDATGGCGQREARVLPGGRGNSRQREFKDHRRAH